jgi:hypothetical protein
MLAGSGWVRLLCVIADTVAGIVGQEIVLFKGSALVNLL